MNSLELLVGVIECGGNDDGLGRFDIGDNLLDGDCGKFLLFFLGESLQQVGEVLQVGRWARMGWSIMDGGSRELRRNAWALSAPEPEAALRAIVTKGAAVIVGPASSFGDVG